MRISDWSSDVSSSDLLMIWSGSAFRSMIDRHLRPGHRLDADIPFGLTSSAPAGFPRPGRPFPAVEDPRVVPPQRRHRPCLNPLFSSRRSEEHTSELQSLMRISYAVFCLKKKKNK